MPTALRRLALLLTLLVLLPTALPARVASAAPAQAVAPELTAALNEALAVAQAELGAPGALLYVSGPGIGSYSGASGSADLASQAPLAANAQVRVASVTKPFVAVVALQLVQEGWLLLDHSVAHWLPGMVPDGEQITVRQLLSHRSGLPDYLANGFVGRARRDPGRVWAPEELVAEALRKPRRFAPGAPDHWAYSNTNYILLGLIVERVTGNPLERELRQRIIEPLGLQSTELAPPSADPGVLARGYVRGQDYTALNMSVAWAAGGLSASVEDMGRFAEALMRGELLRPDTLALLLDCGSTGGAWGIGDLGYGLGVMRRTLPGAASPAEARLALGHTGALGGYRSALWYLPGSGVTIAVALTSYEAEPQHVVTRVLEILAAHGALTPHH
jgi:D-alanyl-D-alanine carboxypeptidase